MKLISTLLVLILVSCIGTKAQKPILVSEDSINIGKNRLPALTVNIPEANYEKTLKSWTKELQSGTKSRLVTENSEMTIFGAKIKEVSPNPINVYSKLVNLDSMLKLTVVFELKKDQYIERATGESDLTKAKNYLKEFARNQYIDLVKGQIDAEDKKLRDIQRELSSLEKDKSSLQKSIQSNNKDIASEKNNILVLNNELATVSAELVEQNIQLSSISEGPVQKEKSDYIKGLEKRKKEALKSIEKSQNKIDKANNEIDKANLEISRNERMQTEVMDKIAKQEAVYQQFVDKLKKIKSS
jgi:chromosome segregation ATPase